MKEIFYKTRYITLLTIILFALIVITLLKHLQTNVSANTNKVLSYPISYFSQNNNPGKYPQGWIEMYDEKENYHLAYPNGLKYSKNNEYFGTVLQKNVVNLIDAKNPSDNKFNLKIIPFSANFESSALKTLESYIVSNVGIAPKNNQRIFKDKGFDIAQIGYHPFADDNTSYFRIYTLLKKGASAWIITVGYTTELIKNDSLNMQNQYESQLYAQIIDSFITGNDSVKEEVNKIDTSKIDANSIKQYHQYNIKFETNI